MKALTSAIAILLLSSTLSATPWYKDKRVWVRVGINMTAATVEIYSASACRHKNGIGPCQGGYGEIRARNGLNLIGAAGTSALGIWGRHIGIKESWVPLAGYTTWNTYEAIHQRMISCPYDEHYLYGTKFTCVPNYSWGDSNKTNQADFSPTNPFRLGNNNKLDPRKVGYGGFKRGFKP